VEVESIEDALRAAELKVDIIMLDNMQPGEVNECVQLLTERGLREEVILEVSGGVNLDNIQAYAATGVDVVSTGMLTHSARSLSFSLTVVG
jgi:nicotinate-nucleotide pyrophosphorylase (carboxylating)